MADTLLRALVRSLTSGAYLPITGAVAPFWALRAGSLSRRWTR